MKKTVKILFIIGILLIFAGLIAQIIILDNKNKRLNDQLTETKDILDKQVIENLKLQYENEALWDNYYMNASEYGGEYYE